MGPPPPKSPSSTIRLEECNEQLDALRKDHASERRNDLILKRLLLGALLGIFAVRTAFGV